MDEYQMCDACYCEVFDPANKTKIETGESK
jgi:hypothetical protein